MHFDASTAGCLVFLRAMVLEHFFLSMPLLDDLPEGGGDVFMF